jgi:hypothetical protein
VAGAKEVDNQENFAPLVAAAAQVLSQALGSQVCLGDVTPLTEKGRRNIVLRCRNLSGGSPSSVIIKQVAGDSYDPDDTASWDIRRFFTDWAGAAFLSTLPRVPSHSPRFYAGDRALGFFVLEDFRPHRSLVEPLLEESAAHTQTALLTFATALGTLHAATRGQAARFERLCRDIHPKAVTSSSDGEKLFKRSKHLQAILERLEVRCEAHFWRELEMVIGAVESPGPFLAYIHGDPCPDNVFFLGEQVRFIDFEFGRFGHALLDATYGRMMFPTCWCANRLPSVVVAQMEAAYRAALIRGCPEAQEDRVFETTLVSVCAFWVLTTLSGQLEGALQEDRTRGRATVRSRLLARLEAFIATAEELNHLSAMRATASRVLEVLRNRWPETQPLPLYPAFREI